MAQYLPVLLVSVSAVSSNPAPDDSSLDTQAIGQVDYLSHEWQEEDVAKSWRNMTRRKDSIQNGARLENASWRTWWKQRNNLPTISPETLNWLKDSDVTWLYGPLHTAADWAPPPRHSSDSEDGTRSPASVSPQPSTLHPAAGLRSRSARSNAPWSLKPILKHRSISELLSISLPPSPGSDLMDLDEEQSYFHHDIAQPVPSTKTMRDTVLPDESRKRPKLTHTKSDTNVHQRNPFRRDSPPLPLGVRAARSRDSSAGDSASGTHSAQRGRHISFNTFVEQCIAIEKPKKNLYDEDSFDETEEGYREDEEDSEDECESEDDVLEMRPTPRSRSTSSRRTPSLSGTSASAWSTSAYDISSPEREHITIAPIAPTVLKTSATPSPVASWDCNSHWEEDEVVDDEEMSLFARPHSERVDNVNLVYVPPQGYAEHMSATAGKISPPHASAEPRAASFDDMALLSSRRNPADVILEPPFETGFDFFSGPDVGVPAEYSSHPAVRTGRSPGQSRSSSSTDLADEVRVHSKGGASSASEDGTVVPLEASAAIPVPRANVSTPSPVLSGTSSSGSPYLEPQPPARGRSTSPINGREKDPPRGRSRSRSSMEGSVSPRSGSSSRLGGGRRASTGLYSSTSPTWRERSLSPEDGNRTRRSGKRARRRGSSAADSVSPPSTVREQDEEPSVCVVIPEEEARLQNPTPSNSPTAAFKQLVRPSVPADETATIAGRAADIVYSARGYLGSLWGGGERLPVDNGASIASESR